MCERWRMLPMLPVTTHSLGRAEASITSLGGRYVLSRHSMPRSALTARSSRPSYLSASPRRATGWTRPSGTACVCGKALDTTCAHAHECATFGDRVIRQECRPVAASPYRYNGHGHLAPASRAELLAMQAMAKMGTADDVLKLLKSFKLLQTASADLIKVHSIHTR